MWVMMRDLIAAGSGGVRCVGGPDGPPVGVAVVVDMMATLSTGSLI